MSYVKTLNPITAHDLSELLALNNRFEKSSSRLDIDKLQFLIEQAFFAITSPELDAFIIALDQDASYHNSNFAWFASRFAKFVYVDRIIVDTSAQGTGIATQLYEGLFERARAAGHGLVTCEVNVDPPNVRSDRFHAKMGFSEVGQMQLPDKTVRYLTKVL